MLSFSLQGDRIYLPAAVSALRSLVTGETLRCVLVLILLIEIVIICLYELVFFRDGAAHRKYAACLFGPPGSWILVFR